MEKTIKVLTIIALVIFIIISIPYLIKTFTELEFSNNESELKVKTDEYLDIRTSNNIIDDKEITSEDLFEAILSELDVQFETEKSNRYKEVKKRLLDVRTIMVEFKNTYGYYSINWDSIVYFAQSQEFNKSINTSLQDLNKIRFIPYSDKQEFHIETGQVEMESGEKKPVFQVKAHNNYFLKDLNLMSVHQLNVKLRSEEKYPGLFIGSLEKDNAGKGNWEE